LENWHARRSLHETIRILALLLATADLSRADPGCGALAACQQGAFLQADNLFDYANGNAKATWSIALWMKVSPASAEKTLTSSTFQMTEFAYGVFSANQIGAPVEPIGMGDGLRRAACGGIT
jgi:hypothetical protein